MNGYLYNGVWMPPIYSRYAEEYDNVILAPGDELVGSYYCFAFSKSPFTTYEENGSIVIRRFGDQPLAYVNHAGDTNWTTGNPTTMSFRIPADKVVWTNHNIYNEDGTLYLAASDPVPVATINHAALMQGFATMLSLKK